MDIQRINNHLCTFTQFFIEPYDAEHWNTILSYENGVVYIKAAHFRSKVFDRIESDEKFAKKILTWIGDYIRETEPQLTPFQIIKYDHTPFLQYKF